MLGNVRVVQIEIMRYRDPNDREVNLEFCTQNPSKFLYCNAGKCLSNLRENAGYILKMACDKG